MRYFLDCEFDGHNGPLLSVGIVREDGDGIHIRADVEPMDLWVRQNVAPLMDTHRAPKSATVHHDDVGGVILAYLGDDREPVFVADSVVDIGRLCRALSTSPDGGWQSVDLPLMAFEVHDVAAYPTDLPGAVQHNAWWDAMALRRKLTGV